MIAASEDHQLLLQVAAGDPRAFRRLIDGHAPPLVTYLTRLLRSQAEAEELAQEVFLRVWQRANEYQASFRVSTWLHRIGHNLAIDQLRRRKGNTEVDEEREAAPQSQRPHDLLEHKQQALTLQAAMDALPLRQRTAMLLKYEQDFPNTEIAKVLDLSVDAVESLLARAKRQLKAHLTGMSDHE
jgi:RNA polymerase sigma-70 factor, ECF subfamily